MKNFIKCGIAGWCIEVIFTGITSYINKDKRMIGTTSILMFPIYGMIAFLKLIIKLVKDKNVLLRGSYYTLYIFFWEFITGSFLKRFNMCPWDYSKYKFNIKGLIRLDFIPAWFGAGLLFEKLLNSKR